MVRDAGDGLGCEVMLKFSDIILIIIIEVTLLR